MQSPVAATNSAPSAQAHSDPSQQPRIPSDARNGVAAEGSIRPSSEGADDARHNSSVVGGSDIIREGKEKAKAVMAASGVRLQSNTGSQASDRADGAVRDRSVQPTPDTVNGVAQSRKRSRSGSRLPQTAPASAPSHPQPSQQEYLLDQYITRDHLHTAVMNDQARQKRESFSSKEEERKYYLHLRDVRRTNPGAVFGHGYAGFGNGHTDDKPRLVYPAQRRRPGNRRTKTLHVSRKDATQQAEQLEELVPVRLDIELDKLKLRDTFTWNLHDRVVTPELFAENLVEDFKVPPEVALPLAQQVNRDIQEQIQDYYPHVFIDEQALDPHLPYHAYKNDEMRVLIKLNITIGPHTLIDQFEWEINNPLNNPEEFARQMARDLSLSGEFTTAIAHSIREQCQMFTRSLYITGHPFDGRPMEDADVRDNFLPSPLPSVFRHAQSAKDYTPYLYELNESDLQREELSILREQRRQKRSVNRRGGPALPDLKDRQRTVRTLVLSSVLPGASDSLEASRLFKLGRPSSGRGRRPGAGRGDGGDDSDESDSDESIPESPAPSQLALTGGTARTRGMRGAATAAQAAMRANLGRSATPEIASLHSHETRRSGRFGGYEGREESVPEPTSLIVKLKISSDKYRRWDSRYRRSGEYQQGGNSSTPLMASQNNTPQPSRSAPTSMPPPPSPAMQQRATPSAASTGPETPSSSSQTKSNADSGTQKQWRYRPDGRMDAPFPQPPQSEQPPAPPVMVAALDTLRRRYPHDRFEATMRWTALDKDTNKPVPINTLPKGSPPPNLKFEYQPRIRCNDCPGKLYQPDPDLSGNNFEVHLKNRSHKENVDARRKTVGAG